MISWVGNRLDMNSSHMRQRIEFQAATKESWGTERGLAGRPEFCGIICGIYEYGYEFSVPLEIGELKK